MRCRLLSIDMDGTLLRDDGTIARGELVATASKGGGIAELVAELLG